MSYAIAPQDVTAPEQYRQQCRERGVVRVQQMLDQSPPPSWRQDAECWLEEQALRSAQLTQWDLIAGIALSLLGIVLVVAFTLVTWCRSTAGQAARLDGSEAA